MRSFDRRLTIATATAVIVLAAGSTVAIAAASTPPGTAASRTPAVSCVAPSLRGAVVDVILSDMGARMRRAASSEAGRRGPMMGGPMMGGPMMGGSGRAPWTAMMQVRVTPSTAPAGVVSLRVSNTGQMTHELVVLPLPDGQAVGDRAVKSDGRVEEADSLGEVSRTCGAGSGDGLAPGETGWTTLRAPVGRYELVCNLPGHYAAGMSALLTLQ
jgi:uncharacterized cupredoxin-like copper-binding protein